MTVRPIIKPSPAEEYAALFHWLANHGGTLRFRHTDQKTYATVTIVDCDREIIRITGCVDSRRDGSGDVLARTLSVLRLARGAVEELGKVPF